MILKTQSDHEHTGANTVQEYHVVWIPSYQDKRFLWDVTFKAGATRFIYKKQSSTVKCSGTAQT